MLYVDCLECGTKIPAALLSKGVVNPETNGLWYRRCPECHWFKWIPPPDAPQARADEFIDPNGFSPTLPPPPPPPPYIDPALSYQGGNWLYDSAATSPHLNMLDKPFAPTPSLPSPTFAFSAPPPSSQPRSQPPTRTQGPGPSSSRPSNYTSTSSKPQCTANCGRVAASSKCKRVLCSQCCEKRGGCAYPNHRKKATTTAVNGNPAALSRPPAVIPASGPSASQLPQDDVIPDSPALKLHRKPMDATWEAQYKVGIKRQQERHRQEDEKRIQARRTLHQVRILYYRIILSSYASKNYPHFPQFNPSLSPRLLEKLKLSADNEVFIYDYKLLMWAREDLNTTITVASEQTLIFRHVDVASEECPRLQEMLSCHAPGKSSSKRKADKQSTQRVTQQARINYPPARHVPSSPTPSLSRSPSPTSRSSPLPSTPRSSSPAAFDLTNDTNDKTNDNTGDASIIDLTVADDVWPAGVYAKDIAAAFGRINVKSGGSDVKGRFAAEYPGVKYVKATYYRQNCYWKHSTQAERDAALLVPRDRDGLWTRWRVSLSGYKVFQGGAKKEKN
ncbi:hypothetical protein C8F01DRAFT_1091985 [Mycena amicta]|nr:hypothetical protein C8F01DRAFT_1091985 [Mycena amicta]